MSSHLLNLSSRAGSNDFWPLSIAFNSNDFSVLRTAVSAIIAVCKCVYGTQAVRYGERQPLVSPQVKRCIFVPEGLWILAGAEARA